jgi:uroporphyrinogen-III synthase
LLLASGSAARSWHAAFGSEVPPLVVAIGPQTADAARSVGLRIDAVAEDHSLDGLVAELERHLVR